MDPETARQSGGDSAPPSAGNEPSEKEPPEKEPPEETSSSKEVLSGVDVLSENEERRHLKRFVRRRKKIVRALARKRPIQ
jgi:hypothetical protein